MSRTHGLPSTYRRGCRCDDCRASIRRERRQHAEHIEADPTLAPHGKDSTYRNWGCRCESCRAAHTQRTLRQRDERAARLAADPGVASHGSASTYNNWGCRCRPCTYAYARARSRWIKSRRDEP